ncbi:MAG: sigma-54-dependent Fis family transcriptional regulator, partial [Deltaproteobacteria bacterium]|nr:sigma-54-dependent Fis family transcriptional regulator [Deltaproteobacteria bacterium]
MSVPAAERKQILVVDDEDSIRNSLSLLLGDSYVVKTAESAEDALAKLEMGETDAGGLPDLVLVDLVMPGLDGLGLLERLRGTYPQMPVIMLTATSAVKSAVQAMKNGAVDYVSKPFVVDELLKLIDDTLTEMPLPVVTKSAKNSRASLPAIEGDFGCMVGQHPLMLDLFQRIDQLAKRDTTVLITGESGTGKELVAREIHCRSNRAHGPFIAINCAAIPETLIESELFGHEKGAFTHAVEKRVGQFELAEGGTLFLDEIGELSLAVQVKILRFLQEHEFYRIGRSKPLKVDVRIVAATNRSLETAIREGAFRQDLYYRINVVNIEMPPLRDRSEDVERLVHAFVERLAPLYGDKHPAVSPEVLEALCSYSWPGNVRELENVMESVLALTNVDTIQIEQLPPRLRSHASHSGAGSQVCFVDAERAFETELIMKALRKSNFIQTRAAELLGISRRILKYKMDKLGIADKPPEEQN